MEIRVLKSGGKKEKPSGNRQKQLEIMQKSFICLFASVRSSVRSRLGPPHSGDLKTRSPEFFCFWHPLIVQMLVGSTRKEYATAVGRQSRQRLCIESTLRQGFRLRRKRLYGAKAPRPPPCGSAWRGDDPPWLYRRRMPSNRACACLKHPQKGFPPWKPCDTI